MSGPGTQSVQEPPLPLLRNGVAQIAFVVKDLDRTVRNYHRFFGIGPWYFYTYGKPLVPRMTRNGKPSHYTMRIALSHFGSMRIELIEQVAGDTVYREFIDRHGYGIHHLGFLVEDMQEAIAQAEAAGFPMTQDGAGFGPDGDGHYAYLDTEEQIGTTIELIQRPKVRREPDKIYPEPTEAGKGA